MGGTESPKKGGNKEFSRRGKKMGNTLINDIYSLRNAELDQGMRKGNRDGVETLKEDALCLQP